MGFGLRRDPLRKAPSAYEEGDKSLTQASSVDLPNFSVAGQVAFVTGASSGIGRRFAEVLAASGAKVALAARREDRLAELAREIGERGGGQSVPFACDVTRQDSIAAAILAAEARLGPLSILVNNAGVVVSKPLFEHTEEDWDYVVDTNLKGAWLMAREFAHHLVEQKRPGRIINISSVLASRTIGRVPAYCAAKAGLTHLTQVLAMELARYGILVNALAPGYVETDFNRAFFQTPAGKALISRIPLKRLGQTPDLDGALLFLASPASAYVTGAVLAVDGGHSVAAI
jgi:NAD(P)-dependent dehydrogenase (short-subunit alcohol dehydrogenase family)